MQRVSINLYESHCIEINKYVTETALGGQQRGERKLITGNEKH